MKNRYEMETLKTVNNLTGNTVYYVKKCDVMTRISKKEYDNRRDQAFGLCDSFQTTNKKYTRYYKTLTFYI